MAKNRLNDPCWCGSGKKYKKCHGHPSYSEKPPISEFIQDQKQVYSKDTCYAPDDFKHECSGKVINAHTVSKSSNLKPIACDSHVYCFKASIGGLIKTGGNLTIEKTSINHTSAFYGFCTKHDTELFKPLDFGFEINDEHIFLNHYRTLVRELYIKDNNALFQSGKLKNYDKGMNIFQQIQFQQLVDDMFTGTDVGLRDLNIIKKEMDTKLVEKRFDSMKYYALIIDQIPEIMSTGVWVVSSDFEDNKLVDLLELDKNYNSMSVSTLLFSKNKGIILFSWDESIECPECIDFIKSLHALSSSDKIKAVVYWLFAVNENIYFSPTWWENLGPSKQKQISDLFHSTLIGLPNLSLYKDLDVVSWEIEDIQTNIEL